MRYLIDGYNLAHALGLIRGKIAPSGIEVARRSLLIKLLEYPGLDGTRVTVVFDAQRAPPGTPSQQHYQGIRILNALGQQADDLIEEMIEQEPQPRQLAVVSNDHRIKDAARHGRCVPLGCLDFLEEIQKPRPATRSFAPNKDPGEKPESLSAEDRRLWYKQFGVEDDPAEAEG
jgi:uncharacterized protein